MAKKLGYARCSTSEARQDIAIQLDALLSAGVSEENIYWEYASGSKDDRKQLQRLLDDAEEGDEIVAVEISRLARSVQKLVEIVDIVQERKLCLTILNSITLDCRPGKEADPATLAMVQMMGVFAELERSMLSERVKAGMKRSRKKVGRPHLTAERLPAIFWKDYFLWKRGDMTKAQIGRDLKVSRMTVERYINLAETAPEEKKKRPKARKAETKGNTL